MYDYLPFVFASIFIGLGLMMTFAPKLTTKKELRESIDNIKKTRRSGIICTIIGIFYLAINLLF